MALLSDLHAEFGAWDLALAAYNQGPVHVRRVIATLNGYVPEGMAAAIVLEHPDLLE